MFGLSLFIYDYIEVLNKRISSNPSRIDTLMARLVRPFTGKSGVVCL